jgi:DNA-binding transcriptional LysR family regulator
MELRHLRYFLEITYDLNMTKAAERLHMSQPPLSRQIKQLEEELETKLFLRKGKFLELTEAGKFFISKAQQILSGVDEAQLAMKRLGRSGHAWINIGFVPSAIYGFLPELLRHYREKYPKLEIHLSEYMTIDQLNALKAGHIDVGFGRIILEDPMIRQEVVLKEPLMIVVSKRHPLAKKSNLTLKQVACEPLIIYPTRPRPNYADQLLSFFYKEGLRPNIIQEVQELQTALGLVASGIGVSIVPKSVQKMRTEDVVYIPFKDKSITSPVVMSYREKEHNKELLNFLKRVRLLSGVSRQRQKEA